MACLANAQTLVLADNTASTQAAASEPKMVLPPGVTEEMLAPPPVPRFMLERSSKPTTMEEMARQAHEAEQKADDKASRKPQVP